MKISQIGIELIKCFEGYREKPYKCPAGFWTIGYGHLIKPQESFTFLTEDEAESLLKEDIITYEKAVKRLITTELTQNQFDALVSFTYNLGTGALQRSTLRQKLNRSEYMDAASEFDKWVMAGGRKLKGLVIRRHLEKLLFLNFVNDYFTTAIV
jgi:lysozyme